MAESVDRYVATHSKSKGTSFLLTLIFGPLGLFYSNWVGALILCVLAVVSAASIIGPVVCWLVAIVVGNFAVDSHNEKVAAAAALGIKG